MLSKSNTRKRAKVHGFLSRSKKTLAKRRKKGRHQLCVKPHSK